jgi:hypothetical protein
MLLAKRHHAAAPFATRVVDTVNIASGTHHRLVD